MEIKNSGSEYKQCKYDIFRLCSTQTELHCSQYVSSLERLILSPLRVKEARSALHV